MPEEVFRSSPSLVIRRCSRQVHESSIHHITEPSTLRRVPARQQGRVLDPVLRRRGPIQKPSLKRPCKSRRFAGLTWSASSIHKTGDY
jgi:hypothetical protein